MVTVCWKFFKVCFFFLIFSVFRAKLCFRFVKNLLFCGGRVEARIFHFVIFNRVIFNFKQHMRRSVTVNIAYVTCNP